MNTSQVHYSKYLSIKFQYRSSFLHFLRIRNIDCLYTANLTLVYMFLLVITPHMAIILQYDKKALLKWNLMQ